MKRLVFTTLTLSLALAGCSGADDGADIDAALLAQYRTAVPAKTQLMASAPKATVHAKLGDPAVFPSGSEELVVGINTAVEGIIDTMRAVVDLPPTLYNSETKEVLWGPYDSGDSFGTVAAYVVEQAEGSDFKYAYALLRGVDKDVAKMTPVIWGGATPDPANDEHGAGVTLWDFEANSAFEEANNPNFASLELYKGRFVAVYAKGAEKSGEAAFVVAAFRNFVSKETPKATPASLDYFYGRYNDGTNTFDFLDYAGEVNVDEDAAMSAAEKVGVHMGFFNEGIGRAEATASGGDLKADQTGSAVECWDAGLGQTYLSYMTTTGGVDDPPVTDGDVTSCGAFEQSLTDLGVPSLKDVDPELLADLDDVATNGVPSK